MRGGVDKQGGAEFGVKHGASQVARNLPWDLAQEGGKETTQIVPRTRGGEKDGGRRRTQSRWRLVEPGRIIQAVGVDVAVVVTPAVSEPAAVRVERESGQDQQVETARGGSAIGIGRGLVDCVVCGKKGAGGRSEAKLGSES